MIVSTEAGPAPARPPAGPPRKSRRRRSPARLAAPIDPPPRSAARPGLSEKLMKKLRGDYGPGIPNDRGQALGDLPEVRAWLESLEARRKAGFAV